MAGLDKARAAAGQLSRFIGVGALNAVLTLVLYQLLNLFIPYWLAYTISFVFGIAFGAALHTRVTFSRALTARSFAASTAVYLLSYLFGLGFLMVLVDGLSIRTEIAPFIVAAVNVPVTFFAMRFALPRPAP